MASGCADKVIMEPGGGRARLLIQTYPLKQKWRPGG